MKKKSVLGGCIIGSTGSGVCGGVCAVERRPEQPVPRSAERVADAGGNLRVPADYRTAYQLLGSLGGGSRPRARARRRSMSFTRRRVRSLPIARMDASWMAPC